MKVGTYIPAMNLVIELVFLFSTPSLREITLDRQQYEVD